MIAQVIKLVFLVVLMGYHCASFGVQAFTIKGVEKEVQKNVSIFLARLDQPDNADNTLYLKQVKDSVRDALYALGYYQTDIQVKISGTTPQQTVSIDISPGTQTHITTLSVRILGEGKTDSRFQQLVADFPLKIGDTLNHGNYEAAKDRLKAVAQQRGYFDAQYKKSSVEVSAKKNSAAVYLWFDTGIRYQFGPLIFQSQLPSEKYIRSLQTFAVGDPFDFEQLRSFNVDINQTGYFKNITLLPLLKEKHGELVPLQVVGTMQPQDSFNVGVGYSTDTEVNGKISWSRPWVNQQGHSIAADLSASAFEQEYSLTYKIPLADPVYDYASIQAGYKVVDQNDTDTEQYLMTFGRHRRSATDWLYNLFIEYDYETGTQGQQDYSTQLILPGISFRKTTSRGGVNTLWGNTRLGSLKAANRFWLSDSDFIKVYGKAKLVRSYLAHQFVAYTELGAIITDSIEDVPSSMRFFTGGDQTVRGYSYESIAPEDEDGYLQGGRYLAVGSLEYRLSIAKSWRLALFTDAGTASNDFSETLSTSTGIGAIWASPVGPVRLYIAKPFNNPDDSLAFHFMLGPEL